MQNVGYASYVPSLLHTAHKSRTREQEPALKTRDGNSNQHTEGTNVLLGSDAYDKDQLFSEFQPLVQRLIRQYGDEPELREDLIGEIYCRFCSVLDAYDPTRGIPLRPYLVHQLAFSVYSYVRRQWRRKKREISIEIDTIVRSIPNTGDISEQWDNAMVIQTVQAGLPHAISQLSLRQRQVVIWRYYEQLSFEEIADRLNMRLATARSTLRHALKNIRRKLQQDNINYE